MPRSFLVKKHLPYKKPNYGMLDSKEHELHVSLPESPCSVSSPQQSTLFWETEPCLMASTPNTLTQMDFFHTPVSKTQPSQTPSVPSESPEREHTFPVQAAFHPFRDSHKPLDTLRPADLQQFHQMQELRVAGELVPSSPATLLGIPGPSSQERFECFDCHKAYFTFSGLAKHRQLHCEWQCHKFFSCKYCDKEYVSLGALKMHIRTHTLPCVCKLCGKAFSRPWLLQGHIRTHTGEKPFSCPHCSRAFADRSNLRAHLQTHSDIKKYQCRSCSKTFSRISLLSKHEEAGCCPMS
ncbi:zinc finger protein SNAI3 [Clupea harengus]|uniref:Zinc finger protein SNAI2 n=1 Tax=Clupea harengus TaxID=7950 RepID=A0A6P3VKX5_CLUHA|nr:zinc finger protein SNAI3 [Clupea harengus]